MKINHNFYLNLALNLAEQNLGKTNSNPSVGCVIVRDNSVISSGVTSINGRPHAEFNALNKNIDFKDADLYVTLEPCTHYGDTPPCTNIIKKKKIKNVFYSLHDPDERTYKRANKKLKKVFKINHSKIKLNDFYQSYIINKKKKFPLIDAKIALSKDFYTINKKSKWITNSKSRQLSHLIRSKYDTIISTSETINKDNSLLNCRIDGLNNFKPDLIIIDRKLKIKKNLKIFQLSNKRKTYLFTCSSDKKKILFLKKKNIKVIRLNKLKDRRDFNYLFKKIFKIGKRRLLIESGLVFLKQLVYFQLINNVYLFKSNVLLKDRGYNNSSSLFLKKLRLSNSVNVNLGNDVLFKARIK